MAFTTSYTDLLKKWIDIVKPKTILEWGPGESTRMMIGWCPAAKITTVEHQDEWFKVWKKKLRDYKNITVLYREAPESDRASWKWLGYVHPTEDKYDLIFIDGRERVRCAEWAKDHLNPNGVILLHDSERLEYYPINKFLKAIDESKGTICLK